MEKTNWKPEKISKIVNGDYCVYSTTYCGEIFYLCRNDNNTYSIERYFGDKIRPINAAFSNFMDRKEAEAYFKNHIKEYLDTSSITITNSVVDRNDTNSIIKNIEFPESINLVLHYDFGNCLMITEITRIIITTDTLAPQNCERILYLRDRHCATITDDNGFFLNLKANQAEKAFFVSTTISTLYIIMAVGKKPPEREKYYER